MSFWSLRRQNHVQARSWEKAVADTSTVWVPPSSFRLTSLIPPVPGSCNHAANARNEEAPKILRGILQKMHNSKRTRIKNILTESCQESKTNTM